jgi:hypothetical protein
MTATPVICFGQQPCGFFPKRFLVAKFRTARRLQQEIGGEIVFFFHDSDHDPRETRTTVHHRANGQAVQLNFEFENKLQRKFSPLFLKRVPPTWGQRTLQALPNYVAKNLAQMFEAVATSPAGGTVADFCLEMYRQMGLLDGFRIARSSDPAFRENACDVTEFFVDVPYQGEIVRARSEGTGLKLHEGGDQFITLPVPAQPFTKNLISPTRDSRLRWMQSVIRCTHYVCGAGEQKYLNTADAPEIQYVQREEIDRSDDAFTDIP